MKRRDPQAQLQQEILPKTSRVPDLQRLHSGVRQVHEITLAWLELINVENQ